MAAEFGAHLTSLSIDTPSIFEVLAQENLHHSIRPAVEYLAKILVSKFPDYAKYMNYFHELYAVLDLVIQNYFLKFYGASFAESFYSLKRIPLIKTTEKNLGQTLSVNVRKNSLIFLVILPYIKLKLDKTFEKERELDADGIRHEHKWEQKFYQLFLYVYPWIHCSWRGVMFTYQMAFTFGKIKCHSPLLHAAGVRLATLTEDDLSLLTASFKFPYLWSLSMRDMVPAAAKALAHNLAVGLTWSLSVGAFFIQFLEWRQANSQIPVLTATPFSIPPPPKLQFNQSAAVLDPGMCPLCLNKRQNDTALSTSGYVFCYRCIHQHLQHHNACPITKYVSSSDHLIRLFPPDS